MKWEVVYWENPNTKLAWRSDVADVKTNATQTLTKDPPSMFPTGGVSPIPNANVSKEITTVFTEAYVPCFGSPRHGNSIVHGHVDAT